MIILAEKLMVFIVNKRWGWKYVTLSEINNFKMKNFSSILDNKDTISIL